MEMSKTPVANRLGGDPHISPAQGKVPQFKMGVKESDRDSVEIYMYGVVGQSWYDYWTDEYHEGNTTDYFKRVLFEEHPDAKAITLYVNSEGGDVFEGTAMANMLRRHPAQVTAVIDGFACSIASVITAAADTVKMPRNAMMMIHNMWTVAIGNAQDLRAVADDMDKMMESNRTIYLDKAGDKLDSEQLKQMLDDETWLSAEECLEYGLCDEILEQAKTEPDPERIEQNVFQRYERIQAMQKARYESLPKVEAEPDPEAEPEPDPIEPCNYLSRFTKGDK